MAARSPFACVWPSAGGSVTDDAGLLAPAEASFGATALDVGGLWSLGYSGTIAHVLLRGVRSLSLCPALRRSLALLSLEVRVFVALMFAFGCGRCIRLWTRQHDCCRGEHLC